MKNLGKSQIPIFNDQTGAAMPYSNLGGSTPTPEPLNPRVKLHE